MNLEDSYNRILARMPWYRRWRMRLWGTWYGLIDWVRDRIYGAPHEAKRSAPRGTP